MFDLFNQTSREIVKEFGNKWNCEGSTAMYFLVLINNLRLKDLEDALGEKDNIFMAEDFDENKVTFTKELHEINKRLEEGERELRFLVDLL